jgi:hypothetical protein
VYEEAVGEIALQQSDVDSVGTPKERHLSVLGLPEMDRDIKETQAKLGGSCVFSPLLHQSDSDAVISSSC